MQHVNYSSQRDRKYRARKQRISLLTGEYYDVPIAQPHEALGIADGVAGAIGLSLGTDSVVEEFGGSSAIGIGPTKLGYEQGYEHYAYGGLPIQRGARTKRRFFGPLDEAGALGLGNHVDDHEDDREDREDSGEDVDVEAPGSTSVNMSLDMDVVPGRRNRPLGAQTIVARAMERGGGAGHGGRRKAKRGRRGPSAIASAENSDDMVSSDVEMS